MEPYYKHHINVYRTKIYDIYNKLVTNKVPFDNYDFSYIAELYSCILLTETHQRPFYVFNDVPVDYKREHHITKHDTGIDFLDMVEYIGQTKLRKKSISWRDISTFLAHLWAQPQLKGILSYNHGITFAKQLDNYRHKINELPFQRTDMIHYCDTIEQPDIIPEQVSDFQLRDYQIDCLHKCRQCEPDTNIFINLPTGSGKTVIMTMLIEPSQNVLILVPRIVLLEQTCKTLIKFRPELKDKIQLIGDNNNPTINPDKQIIISVYNSITHIENHLDSDYFHKIFVDEAHHILKPSIYTDNQSIDDDDDDDDNDNCTYIRQIADLIETKRNIVAFSATMDDPHTIYPEMKTLYYSINVRDLIRQNYLTDYEITFPVFKQLTNQHICQYLVNRCHHYIIYCSNHEHGSKINQLINQMLPNSSAYVDCYTPKHLRKEYLEKYSTGKLLYLVNVRVLTEGFDAPITQGVCLLQIPSSKILAIQILGRTLRLHPNKSKANILFPIDWNQEYDTVARCVKILTDNDDKYQKLSCSKDYAGYLNIIPIIDTNTNHENDTDDEIDMDNWDPVYENVFDSMGRCLDYTERWFYYLNQVEKYIREYNKLPSSKSKSPDVKRLGQWLDHQKQNEKSRKYTMSNETIYQSWLAFKAKYPDFFLDNAQVWKKKVEQVEEYIRKHNKLPSQHSKLSDVKRLGQWLGDQKQKEKSRNRIMSDETIYQSWLAFKAKYPEFFNSIE